MAEAYRENRSVCGDSIVFRIQNRYDIMRGGTESPHYRFFSAISDRISTIIASPPPHYLRAFHERIKAKMGPASGFVRPYALAANQFATREPLRKFSSSFQYKAVAGLIGANLSAFMLLNSRYMKSRSPADNLPRVDRHFIASKYNVSCGRIWSVPLSLFNHSDSLFRLGMNCVGIALVGPAVELAFGGGVLVSGFLISGSLGAIAEMVFGNHWCRGSSAGVTGVFGMTAFASPHQKVSVWGVWDVRAASLAISLFFIESLLGVFGSSHSEVAHVAHAAGLLSSIPFLYYLRWFRH